MNFAKELKEGTKKSHSAVEKNAFDNSFLRGHVSKESYRTLVSDLYFVYVALEEEFRIFKNDPILGALYLPELERVVALETDLRYYFGPIWRSIVKPSEQCQRYVDRIHEVAKTEPELLIGHHYTRYLGDLSGGQILKGIAEKALNLNGEGLNFYEFGKIDNAKIYKEKYRSILDKLPLTDSQQNAIITEANYAFRLNMYMFEQLEGNSLVSFFKILMGVIRGKLT